MDRNLALEAVRATEAASLVRTVNRLLTRRKPIRKEIRETVVAASSA